MAGRAGSRQPNVISDRGICVASIAFHHGMSAQKRESIKVLLNRLIGNLPSKNRMALGAIGSHLRAVNIRVAIRAIFSYFRKYRLRVAARAGYFRVHSAKRISSRVMIKFRDSADRGPG
jgi:hypothetical protein